MEIRLRRRTLLRVGGMLSGALLAELAGLSPLSLLPQNQLVARAALRSSQNVALVPNATGQGCCAGTMPTGGTVSGTTLSFADFQFTNLPIASVSAASLAAFDTLVLVQVLTGSLSAQQKADINSYVDAGNKLVIYDSDATQGNDYSWLRPAFSTSPSCPNCGLTTGTITIVENNTLGSDDPASPDYVKVADLLSRTDAVGDANVVATSDPNWFGHLRATNARGQIGWVHTYAESPSGKGVLIYNGFDTDFIGSASWSASGIDWLAKLWYLELKQQWNPTDLPGSTPLAGDLLLGPLSGTAQDGQNYVLTLRATGATGGPLPGLSVTFTMTGANPQSGTAVTNSSGTATFSYKGAKPGRDTVVASAVIGGQQVNSNTVHVDWTVPPITIAITSVIANQGVEAMDINGDKVVDLVAERPTVIRTHVEVATPLGGGIVPLNVEVQLSVQGNSVHIDNPLQVRTHQQLLDNPIIDFFATPTSPGKTTIVATIDPANKLGLPGSASKVTLPVDIKPVREIRYTYFRLSYLDKPLDSTANFATTVADSGDYLQAVYPLAPNHFVNESAGISLTPSILSYKQDSSGAMADALQLWTVGQLLSPTPERVVGIVPKRWFTYHNLGKNQTISSEIEGVHWPNVVSVAIVQDGRPLVTAHELGHSYGFGEGYVKLPDGTCCASDGVSTSGYWVQRQQEVTNAIDYMGASVGQISYPDQATKRWSTADHFKALFQNFRESPNDPEVVLVAGTIAQDGTAALNPMYRVLNGTVSQPQGGDAAVQVLDARGNLLANVPFMVDFSALTDPPIVLDIAPFAFAVPYPTDASQLRIIWAGRELLRVNLFATLLRDAVASIPDSGFDTNATQRRDALLHKIDALDTQISAGALTGARDNLANDIRTSLVAWLVDNYTVESPLQYTKAAILALVDELLGRLGGFS